MVYSASGIELQAVTRYLKDSTPIAITGHILGAKGFAVDEIEDLEAECIQDDEKFGDTSVAKSWEPQNGQHTYFTGETLYDAYLRTIVADLKYDIERRFSRPLSRGYSVSWSEIDRSTSPFVPQADSFTSFLWACNGRRYATTKGGLIGLVPRHTQL